MAGMKVTVLGLGERTALPLIEFLHNKGCEVFASEFRTTTKLFPDLKKAEKKGGDGAWGSFP